jgi:hypothetical protein
LFSDAITDTDKYYFLNVKILKLENDRIYSFLETTHIECLKSMVNLYSLTHLDIPETCSLESSSIMLKLLKETPNLSSFKIEKDILLLLSNDSEVC